jgi:GntR family transcriptional regulator, transcriptional repressor for pyruvate dehydrogenase complex
MNSSSVISQKLQKLAPVRIFEQAVEQIRGLISSGALEVGEKLPTEAELSRQFGVSRSSVREALRVLEAEGSIEIRRGSGAFISARLAQRSQRGDLLVWLEKREETLEQVLEVRESIEALTASLAARMATPEALAEIRVIVEDQTVLNQRLNGEEDSDIDALARLDILFHLAVSSASGNDIAHEIISHILPAFNESNKAVLFLGHRSKKMESEHRQILSALEAHNVKLAAEAMTAHIRQVRKEILDIQPQRPHLTHSG